MTKEDIVKVLEDSGYIKDSAATQINYYTVTRSKSLTKTQVENRNSTGWAKGEFVIAEYCDGVCLIDILDGWRRLTSKYKNQYLILEVAEDTWEMYDSDCNLLGGEKYIKGAFVRTGVRFVSSFAAPVVVRPSSLSNPGDPNFKPASSFINSTVPSQLEKDMLELIVNFRLPLVTEDVCFADILDDLEVEFSPEEKTNSQLIAADLLKNKLDELKEQIAELEAKIYGMGENGYDYKLHDLYGYLLRMMISVAGEGERLLADSGDKVAVSVPLLGEFVSGSNPKVVIYYKNIEKSIQRLSAERWQVIAAVFVHEMFHAWNYFCAGENARSVLAIDEPMVEFEALYFLNKLKDYTKEQSHYLKDKVSEVYRDRTHRVQQKQKSIGNVAAYGFGYYLHENLSDADAINWIETYSGKSAFIDGRDPLVEEAEDALIPVYPFRSEDKVLELFKQIVFNAHVTSVTAGKSVAAKPASPVSSEVTPESSHTDTRKIKVKGFDDTRMDRLEAKINEFLNENDVEVVDIKFSSAAELSNGRSHSRFAALLLYRER